MPMPETILAIDPSSSSTGMAWGHRQGNVAQLKDAGLIRAMWRVVQILSVLLVGLWWRTIDRWSWTYRSGETLKDRQQRRAEWLLGRLIWLGPAFVKVGQSLGTRPDLLPLT